MSNYHDLIPIFYARISTTSPQHSSMHGHRCSNTTKLTLFSQTTSSSTSLPSSPASPTRHTSTKIQSNQNTSPSSTLAWIQWTSHSPPFFDIPMPSRRTRHARFWKWPLLIQPCSCSLFRTISGKRLPTQNSVESRS